VQWTSEGTLKGELQSPTQKFSQQIHSFTTSKKKENPSKRALHLLLKILTKKKSPVCNIKENLVRKAASPTENSHKKSQFAIRVAWSGNAAAMRHFRPDLHRHRRLRKELLIHSERTKLIWQNFTL
jgi:hypothetical protein